MLAVGGVIGFALVFRGEAAIVWNDEKADFPFRSGISVIVMSWFTSPIFAAIASAIIFFLCRVAVLRRENSFQKTFYVLPVAILVTAFINIFFVLSKVGQRVKPSFRVALNRRPYFTVEVVFCCYI